MKTIKNKKELGAIFVLAWPTMVEEFMYTAVQYIDTAMVGSLGTKATAAVGATSTVNWLIGSSISAAGVGFLAYISQALGAEDDDRARKAAAQSVLLVLMIGIVMTAVTQLLSNQIPVWMKVDPSIRNMAASYFRILYIPILFRTASTIFGVVIRAAGDTRSPMRIGVSVNIINVILNFLLIYPSRRVSIFGKMLSLPGAGLNINGAAAASAIAYSIGGIAMTVCFFRHKKISPVGQSLKPDGRILTACLRVSFPSIVQRFATSLGYVFFAAMINSLGDVSTAAHTIANTVESAFYIPGYGMQSAAAILAGNALGAGDKKRISDLSKLFIQLEVVLMILSGGLLFAFAPALVRIFSKDPEIIRLGSTILRMVAVSEPIYGVPIALEGIMQGMGRTVPAFLINITGMWGVRIVGTYICTVILGLGLISAWGCMIGHNTVLFFLFLIYYFRVFRLPDSAA